MTAFYGVIKNKGLKTEGEKMPPVIDKELCTKCGRCWEACPGDVFYGSQKGSLPVVTYPNECWYEGSCVHDCPVPGAIKLRIPLPMMISYK